MSSTGSNAEVRSLLDVLIPGDSNLWPHASTAVDLNLLDTLLAERRAFLDQHAQSVFRLSEEQREGYLRRLEIEAPNCFGSLLAAVYGAYYGSQAVQMALRSLSELSPKEKSPHVDPNLVARVRDDSRGLPRL